MAPLLIHAVASHKKASPSSLSGECCRGVPPCAPVIITIERTHSATINKDGGRGDAPAMTNK
jgi:hypothetical protein